MQRRYLWQKRIMMALIGLLLGWSVAWGYGRATAPPQADPALVYIGALVDFDADRAWAVMAEEYKLELGGEAWGLEMMRASFQRNQARGFSAQPHVVGRFQAGDELWTFFAVRLTLQGEDRWVSFVVRVKDGFVVGAE